MPQQSATPGVYVHELPAQSQAIQGVSTSVAAFVGLAPWGPTNTPTRITSWNSFARTFGVPHSKETPDGPFMDGAYLAHAVYGFFTNGGAACWVVRVGDEVYGTVPQAGLPSATTADAEAFVAVASGQLLEAKLADPAKPAQVTVKLSAEGSVKPPKPASGSNGDSGPPAWTPTPTYTVEVSATGLDPKTFPKETTTETFTGLTVSPGPQYLATLVSAKSKFVQILEPGGLPPGAARVPQEGSWTLTVPEAPAGPPAAVVDLAGDPDLNTGMLGLAMAEEVTTVCIPDLAALAQGDDDIREIHTALSDFCTRTRRMAILDPPQGFTAQDIQVWQQDPSTPSSQFATLYWPWIHVMHPTRGGLIEVPPCGHMAGVWARVDESRGVFKAPGNEVVMGAVDVATSMNDADQDPLNANGVNCIRGFPGRGIRAWGARTLATDSDTEWMYINVRRLFNFIEASVARGTTWAVFEPNDEMLWARLRVSVSNFLTEQWRGGALFGASPDEAFFVSCDVHTNPPDLVAAGQVNVQVGIAPVEPAEFVIFTVSQYQLPAAS